MLAPAGEVYQAGTLSGNPLAVAAGLATLALLDDAAYLRLARLTERLAAGLRERPSGGRGVRCRSSSAPGLLTVFFSEDPVHELRGRAGLRPRGLRGLVPRAALARRLPAGVAVRGVVPLARARPRAARAHAVGRGGRVRGGRERGAARDLAAGGVARLSGGRSSG